MKILRFPETINLESVYFDTLYIKRYHCYTKGFLWYIEEPIAPDTFAYLQMKFRYKTIYEITIMDILI